jgi:gas vesicle protein
MKKAKKGKKKSKRGYGAALAGGLIGAALGVGAGLLAQSKTGKQFSAEFYRYLAPQIKGVNKMREPEYKKFVAEAMKRYGKDKKFSRAEARRLVKDAQASWKHLEGNL